MANVEGEVWVDYDADGVRDGDERDGSTSAQVYADYDHDGAPPGGRDDGRAPTPTAPTRCWWTRAGSTRANRVDVRLLATRASRIDPEFAAVSASGARGLRADGRGAQRRDTRGASTSRTSAPRMIRGLGLGRQERGRPPPGRRGRRPGQRVFLDDDRDGRFGTGELGRASLRDGTLRPADPDALPGRGRRAAAARGRAGDRRRLLGAARVRASTGCAPASHQTIAAAHGVARPVVIFIHGYGGSRITCSDQTLWFNPAADLRDIRLGPDGRGLRARRGRLVLLAERAHRRAGRVRAGLRHLRQGVQALRGITVARPPLRLRVGLADLARGRGRPARRLRRAGALRDRRVRESDRLRVQLVAHSRAGSSCATTSTAPTGPRRSSGPWPSRAVPRVAEGDLRARRGHPGAELRADRPVHRQRRDEGRVEDVPRPLLAAARVRLRRLAGRVGVNGGRPLDVDGVEAYLRRIGVDAIDVHPRRLRARPRARPLRRPRRRLPRDRRRRAADDRRRRAALRPQRRGA